jgi:hypothetical protein
VHLLGLFEEAWDRTRRRRRWFVAAAIVAAAIVAGVVATTQRDSGGRPRRVPATSHPAVLSLPRAPGIGVACPGAPNNIACDRVGIEVWVSTTPALPAHLVATIGDKSVELHDRTDAAYCASKRTCSHFYTGYLQHAGLLNGVLKVQPDQGRYRWYGRHPVTGTLRLVATYRDGRTVRTTRRVALGPGWG